MATEYIYGLIDPTNSMISYIGRTFDPMDRWDGHMNDDSETSKTQWIRRLKAVGIMPTLVILEKVEGNRNVAEVERLWIDMGLRIGWPLTNSLLTGGTKYKKREIDRFSESIADWLVSNHLDRIVKALGNRFDDANIKTETYQEETFDIDDDGVPSLPFLTVREKRSLILNNTVIEDAAKIKTAWLNGSSAADLVRIILNNPQANTGGANRTRMLRAVELLKNEFDAESEAIE